MPKSYSIVGMNWQKAEEFVKALAPETPVVLIREPENEHDSNAVAVYVEGRKVGFIPSKQNKVLAMFIDQTGQDLSTLAMDSAATRPVGSKYISAKYFRSPNSGYPMVEVVE